MNRCRTHPHPASSQQELIQAVLREWLRTPLDIVRLLTSSMLRRVFAYNKASGGHWTWVIVSVILTHGRATIVSSFFGPLDIPLPLKGFMGPCFWCAHRLQPSQPYGLWIYVYNYALMCKWQFLGMLPSLKWIMYWRALAFGNGNVLFDDVLNTFLNLRLYGIGHMVNDHSDSEKGHLLPPLHGLLFPIRQTG